MQLLTERKCIFVSDAPGNHFYLTEQAVNKTASSLVINEHDD